jgi:hypothetical protein
VAWDSICAGEAQDLCEGCAGAGCPGQGGDCCSANGTPGCDDLACCEAVCAIDPFCCDVAWDSICAGEAADLCEICGGPPPGSDCCTPHPTPGCDDAACEALVCGIDPFCCDVEWDSICVGEAEDLCGGLCGGGGNPACGPGAGDCCVAHPNPGCDDVACCEAVCAIDPFCCDVQWDSICVGEAFDLCEICGGGGASCCVAHPTPGCDDPDCEAAVCGVDPFCCDVEWDGICVGEAFDLCGDLCVAGDCEVGFSCGQSPVPCASGPPCYCGTAFDGSFFCFEDTICPGAGPCPDGSCPAGTVCLINSCCGQPVCVSTCGTSLQAPPFPGGGTGRTVSGVSAR